MKKIALIFTLLLLNTIFVRAQIREFKGIVVITGTETPIAKASIRVTGDTKFKTKTNENGEFTIPFAKGKFTISASAKHFNSLEIAIPENAKEAIIGLMLNPDFLDTDEQAFGSVSKIGNSAPSGEVKLNKIAPESSRNILEMLRTVPGVTVSPSGSIRIRGAISINAQPEPLIVVDGVAFNGDITSLDPNEIDKITVLKDSSTSLYGARGAAGVILITTKSK